MALQHNPPVPKIPPHAVNFSNKRSKKQLMLLLNRLVMTKPFGTVPLLNGTLKLDEQTKEPFIRLESGYRLTLFDRWGDYKGDIEMSVQYARPIREGEYRDEWMEECGISETNAMKNPKEKSCYEILSGVTLPGAASLKEYHRSEPMLPSATDYRRGKLIWFTDEELQSMRDDTMEKESKETDDGEPKKELFDEVFYPIKYL